MKPLKGLALLFCAVVAALAFAGCKLTFDASGKAFKCESNNDCAAGYRCSEPIPGTTIRVCVDSLESNDIVGPSDTTGDALSDTTNEDAPPSDLVGEDSRPSDASNLDSEPSDVSNVDITPPNDTAPGDITPPNDSQTGDLGDGVIASDGGTADAIVVDQIDPSDGVPPSDLVTSKCLNPLGCVEPPVCSVPLLDVLGGNWVVSNADPPTLSSETTSTYCISEAPPSDAYTLNVSGGITIKPVDEKAEETEIEFKDLSFAYALCSSSFALQSGFIFGFKATLKRTDLLLTIARSDGDPIPIGCASVTNGRVGGKKLILRFAFADLTSRPTDMPQDLYLHHVVTITFVSQ